MIILDILIFIKNTLQVFSTIPCNKIELGEKVIINNHPGIN